MELKKNVVAAVASALGAYIQMEQEAAALMALQQKALVERPYQPYIPYAMAGRQAAMEARWMWQMRLAR
jgi:hypothetical protein